LEKETITQGKRRGNLKKKKARCVLGAGEGKPMKGGSGKKKRQPKKGEERKPLYAPRKKKKASGIRKTGPHPEGGGELFAKEEKQCVKRL